MSKFDQFLIRRSVSWLECEYDVENPNVFSRAHYSGVIAALRDRYAIVQLDDERIIQIDLYSLVTQVEDQSIKQAAYRYLAILRRQAKLADRTPHEVYALVDLQEVTEGWNPDTTLPEPHAVHYVGMSQQVKLRLRQHICCSGYNFQKIDWIRGLQARGLQPHLFTLEEIEGKHIALRREEYWTRYYLSHNAPLTNNEALWLSHVMAAERAG